MAFVLVEASAADDHTGPQMTLIESIKEFEQARYYWGAITAKEANRLLDGEPHGTFLIRDSAYIHAIVSISYRIGSNTYHSRVQCSNGLYCLGNSLAIVRARSVCRLIHILRNNEHTRVLTRPSQYEPYAEPVSLKKPLDRINMLPSLQYLCRIVIRRCVPDYRDIDNLPIPRGIKDYVAQKKFLLVHYSNWETKARLEAAAAKKKSQESASRELPDS